MFIDIIDFKLRITKRYSIATYYYSKLIKNAKKQTGKKEFVKSYAFEYFFNGHKIVPHQVHMNTEGIICTSNAIHLIHIDTQYRRMYFSP